MKKKYENETDNQKKAWNILWKKNFGKKGGGHVLDIRAERKKAATTLAEMKTMVAPLVEWTNNSDDECDEFQIRWEHYTRGAIISWRKFSSHG